MIIKRISPMSCAKVGGLLYAAIGLLVGAGISLVMTTLGSLIPADEAPMAGAAFGMMFGAGAIVIMPIFYGVLGFLGGAITALAYNLIADWTGGLELEVQ
jgi:hypothetical protein